jgi:YD repeat-containing protein
VPVASFTATPNPVSLTRAVAFDASGSHDDDGTIVRHEWDLDGNGSYETDTGNVGAASRAYASSGAYAVKLRITDDDGAQATATVSVTAVNVLPVAAIVATPATVDAGQQVTLDATGSSDADGTLVKYDWDLDGNGTYEATSGAAPTRTHTYPNAGGFTVGVRVTDNDGGSRTASTRLVVRTPATGGGTTTGGDGTGGSSGGSGTGTGGSGSGAGDGTAPPARLQATLAGSPLQRLAGVLRRGLDVACRTDRAATCRVRAELRSTDARRLGLRSAAGRAVLLGRLTVTLRAAGTRRARLRLTPAARRALRRATRVSLVVRGTATSAGSGGGATVARTFLVRR